MIYADYAATSPMSQRALRAFERAAKETIGNPSSLHGFGQRAQEALEKARRQCASLIGGVPEGIVFTSGGTESDNLALRGAGRRHLVVSAVEHPAILRTAEAMEKEGVRLTVLTVDEAGRVNPEALERVLAGNDTPALVSVMLANNETGVIQPIRELADTSHRHGALFHCDGVQGAGHVPVDVSVLGCDLMSVSAHKLYGPKGAGFLYVAPGVTLTPILTGGPQEHGLRGGTESVPLLAAFGEACEEAAALMASEGERIAGLRDRIERELLSLPDVRLNGGGDRLPGVVNLSFGGVGGEALTLMCDLNGVALSSGSACHAGDERPSHVLCAMGLEERYLTSALRISLGRFSTAEDVREIVRVVGMCVSSLRLLSAE